MRFAIFGVGAIGGYFGGRLAQSGSDVVFIARGRTLQVLQNTGLRVESPKGGFQLSEIQVTGTTSDVGPVDCVLLGVKSWQVTGVAPQLKPLLGSHSCVLPLQNGVEAPSQLAAELGSHHVLGGLCWIISSVVEPGHVRHSGIEPAITFGELNNQPTARVDRLVGVLLDAGIKADVSADIHAAMWRKFVFICSVGGVGAVTRAGIGEIREHPGTREMLEACMKEIAAVGAGLGVPLDRDIVPQTMVFVDGLPAGSTASMQRDLMAGRVSELEAQTGAVVRLGRDAGVPTPVNDYLYRSLILSERRARGLSLVS